MSLIFPFYPLIIFTSIVLDLSCLFAFLGGAIGALGAYFAAKLTIENNQKQWQYDIEQRERPIIEAYFETKKDPQDSFHSGDDFHSSYFILGYVYLSNVGSGHAHDINIKSPSKDIYIGKPSQRHLISGQTIRFEYGIQDVEKEEVNLALEKTFYENTSLKIGFKGLKEEEYAKNMEIIPLRQQPLNKIDGWVNATSLEKYIKNEKLDFTYTTDPQVKI